MAAVSKEIEILASAKAKLAKQFSGNFDPRLGEIYIPPLGAKEEIAEPGNTFPSCHLLLMQNLPETGIPEKGKMYLEKMEHRLRYIVETPRGEVVENYLDMNISELTTESLSEYSSRILQETSKRGHSRVPLLREIVTRFTDTPLRSLLLLGNSGMGKTCLSLRLCKMVWEMVAEGAEFPLPLYVYLPQYKEKLQKGLLEQVLKDADLSPKERRVIRRQPLLLILDGFDEVSVNHNLYQSQGWGKQGFNIKMLVSCRPEALLNKNSGALFEAGERFGQQGPSYQKLYLQFFNDKQIEQYLQTYLDKGKKDGEAESAAAKGKESEKEAAGHVSVQDYLIWLEKLPSLKALVKTPFLLMVVAEALPSIMQELSQADEGEVAQKHFTQNELFRRFLGHWFFRQAQRVKEQGLLKELSHEELAGYMHAYAQNLASSRMGADGQLDESPLMEEQCLKPEFIEPVHDRVLLERYHHQNPKLRQSLSFFTVDEAGKKIPILEHLQAVRSGCLLHTIGKRFKFLHKSITEYLAARELMEGLLGNYDCYLETLLGENAEEGRGLNRVLLTLEPEIIKRLAEVAEVDARFKQLLNDIVIASNDTLGLSIAAANAITVLNYAGVDFTGQNLSEVQIAGADLRGGSFLGTNFKGANLSGVNFSQAYLGYADWRGAEVSNINLGERAYYKLPQAVNCVAAYYPNAESLHWLVGCEDGYVYHFDDKSGVQLRSYRHNDYFGVGSDGGVTALAIRSHSHLLVTAGANSKLWLWDLTTGKAARALTGHTDWVLCVTLSADGKLLVSGSMDGTLRLWHLPQGRPGPVLTGHTGWVWCIMISADGKLLVSGSGDKTLRLWYLPQGRFGPVLMGHTDEVLCITLSTDGKWLVSGSNDNTLRLWHLPQGSPGPVLTGHRDHVNCITISTDGKLLVSGSKDETLRLWQLPEGRPGPVLTGHRDHVSCVTLSADGKWLASGSWDKTLRLWHLPQGSPGPVLTGHTTWVSCVTLSADGKQLVSGGWDKMLRLWHLPQGSPGPVLMGHTGWVSCVTLSADGKLLVSGSRDKTLRLWQLPQGRPGPVLTGHTGGVSCVTLSADGNLLVSGSWDYTLRLWHLPLPQRRPGPVLTGHTGEVSCVTLSADGKLLVSGSRDETLRLWHLPQGRPGPVLTGHTGEVSCVTLSADGKLLVSGSCDKTLRLWQLPEGTAGLVLTGHTGEVGCVTLSADGKLLVSGGYDTLCFWALPSGKLLSVLPLGFVVYSLAMRDHQLIVGGEHGFLLSIQIDTADLSNLKPRFDWLRRGKAELFLGGLQIEEALHLSPINQALCAQRGSVGKANPNVNVPYQAWCSLFTPIVGTAHHEAQPSLVGINQAGRALHTITENSWVLSVTRKIGGTGGSSRLSFLSGSENTSISNHAFLILEGIKNHRRFIIRAELTVDMNTAHVDIKLYPLDNLSTFEKSVKNYEANQFEISAKDGHQLLRNIRADQQKTILYNIRGDGSVSNASSSASGSSQAAAIEMHNCLSWCRKQVRLIGLEMPAQWYNFLITLPSDVISSVPTNEGSSTNTTYVENDANNINSRWYTNPVTLGVGISAVAAAGVAISRFRK